MSTVKKIPLDQVKFRRWMKAHRLTATSISLETGRAPGYISRCLCQKELPVTQLKIMESMYGLQAADIAPDKMLPVTAEKNNADLQYSVKAEVGDRVVRFYIMLGDELVQSAWSKIKDDSELSVIQAISYAAHMCYKLQEQKELETEVKC